MSVFGRLSLVERRGRGLLKALTGTEIGEEPWWSDYNAHVNRRHAVVHEGVRVTKEEAEASVESVRQFILVLGNLWEAARPDDPELWEPYRSFHRDEPPGET